MNKPKPKVGLLLFTAEWFAQIGAHGGSFGDLPRALENTLVIAERCAGPAAPRLDFSAQRLPRFDLPPGQASEAGYLRALGLTPGASPARAPAVTTSDGR